jgi:threonine/homoserine/homoserine lactone efflux protein
MLTALLVGVVLGFVLSIPPGPIGIAVIKHALEGDHKNGAALAMGAAMMDVLYTLAAAFASSALMVALNDYISTHQIVIVAFQLLCIVVLVTLGIKYLRAPTKEVVDSVQKEAAQEQKAERLGFSSPILIGVVIAVTNLASPTFIPSLILFASMARHEGYLGPNPWESVTYSLGFGIGAGLWFLALLRTLFLYRKKLPPRFITYIYYFAGTVFGVSALLLTYNVVTATHWALLFGPSVRG